MVHVCRLLFENVGISFSCMLMSVECWLFVHVCLSVLLVDSCSLVRPRLLFGCCLLLCSDCCLLYLGCLLRGVSCVLLVVSVS